MALRSASCAAQHSMPSGSGGPNRSGTLTPPPQATVWRGNLRWRRGGARWRPAAGLDLPPLCLLSGVQMTEMTCVGLQSRAKRGECGTLGTAPYLASGTL